MVLKLYYKNNKLDKITRTDRKNKEKLEIIKIYNENKNLHYLQKNINEELEREITRYYLNKLQFNEAVELNIDSKKGGSKLQEYINEQIGYDFL